MPDEPQNSRQIIDRLEALIRGADDVLRTHRPSEVAGARTLDTGMFEKWRSGSSALLRRVCGSDHTYTDSFNKRVKEEFESHVEAGQGILESVLADFKAGDFDQIVNVAPDAITHVLQIAERFHAIARQLRARHSDRPTLTLDDEYDMQDLLHALLRMFFDDVRAEEWAPSYAGASSRMDFLLKSEQIVIETKRARNSLRVRELGTQLIEDIARYRIHPDCRQLVCFVYDPEGIIPNPRGVETDLADKDTDMPVTVLIRPE